MAKEIIVNEEKKTLWSRFTSWLASSWLGKAWKSITGLFSSNKTSSQASGDNQSHSQTSGQSKDSGQGTGQQQEPLAAAASRETPEVESPATPDNNAQSQGSSKRSSFRPMPSHIKINNGQLEIRLAYDVLQNLEDYKNTRNGKYRMQIGCNKSMFNITFEKKINEDSSVSLLINTVQKQIGNKIYDANSNMKEIKRSLGFKKGESYVVIDSIDKLQSQAKSPEPAANSNTLNSSVTGTTESKVKSTATPNNNAQSQDHGKGAVGSRINFHNSIAFLIAHNGSVILNIYNCAYQDFVDNYKNRNKEEEFCVFVKLDGKDFRITGRYDTKNYHGYRVDVYINSVKHQGAEEKDVSGDFTQMKKMLGLDGKKHEIKINEISNVPFIPKVESPTKPANDTQPNPSMTRTTSEQTANKRERNISNPGVGGNGYY